MLADAVTLSSDPLTDCGSNTEPTSEFRVPIEPPGDAGVVKKPKTHILGSRPPKRDPFCAESRRGNGFLFFGSTLSLGPEGPARGPPGAGLAAGAFHIPQE